MAPNTRRSRPRVSSENQGQISLPTHQSTNVPSQSAGQNVTKSTQSNPGQRKRKRAKSRTVTNAPSQSEPDAIKRARDKDGHPMALLLTEEGDTEEDEALARVVEVNLKQRASIGSVKGTQRDNSKRDLDQQSDPSSFQQPGHNSLLDIDPDLFDVGDNVENANDWVGDELSHKNSTKKAKALALERPTWCGANTSSSQVVDGSTPSMPSIGGLTSTQNSSGSSQASSAGPSLSVPGQGIPTMTTAKPHMVTADWTDLVFSPDGKTIKLTAQRRLVRLVIKESFEILHSLLLSTHAYPDGAMAIAFVRDALLRAVLTFSPGAAPMYKRIENDREYFCAILPLPRVRISTFRSDIKDQCCKIVVPAMDEIGEPADIERFVKKQLADFTYTCARAPGFPLSWGLVMRTRLYRNDRIIAVIHNMFFVGESNSFATHFANIFRRRGVSPVRYEVPLPLVCLVTTALYVALLEWQSGERQLIDFTASAFIDVYASNVHMLQHILDSNEDKYHHIMEEIYTLASAPTPATISTTITPPINIDELE